MYTRTYPPRAVQDIPQNYSGTALEREEEKPFLEEKAAPVCCEMQEEGENPRTDEEDRRSREEHGMGQSEGDGGNLPSGSFASGDLLILALATLLVQSEVSDNELLLVLLLLLIS